MRDFRKNKIDTLADVFCAWMGGIPDNDTDIKSFLSRNEELAGVLSHRDIEHIIHYHGYFPKETVRMVFAVLPAQIKLLNGEDFAVFERFFTKLNKAEMERHDARVVNVDMFQAYRIFMTKYPAKRRFMKKNRGLFGRQNEKILFPNRKKEGYHRRCANMTEEQKEEIKEKSRERMRKWRAEHPEKVIKAAKQAKERRQNRTPLQIISDRISSRKNNRKYRQNNREEIKLRRNNSRLHLKEKNPELLKEMDKKTNSYPSRKEVCRNYYQKHKEQITQKAKDNPKVRIYKKKYEIKKRWREKTGVKVMSLLQAIILTKQSGR